MLIIVWFLRIHVYTCQIYVTKFKKNAESLSPSTIVQAQFDPEESTKIAIERGVEVWTDIWLKIWTIQENS